MSAFIIAFVSAAILVGAALYLNRPAETVAESGAAPAEAKAYLAKLELSDVEMRATENFMKQQVVEVEGKIANHGSRKLALIEVYCLFFGMDGKEIHRERLPIIHVLNAQETKSFRLPFDSLPDGWNQAMPRLVIAKIAFAS